MSQQGPENEIFIWDSDFWGDICNEDFSNSSYDVATAALETGEDKGKKGDQVVAEKEKGANGKRRAAGQGSSHEMHILIERDRRKKMKNLFSTLQSLLPNLPSRADKSAVVEEATNYIKTLQDTLQRLEKQKLEKLQGSNSLSSIAATLRPAALSTKDTFISNQVSTMDKNDYNPALERTSNSHLLPAIIQTWSSPNVALNVFGENARIVVSARKKPRLFANICSVLDQYRLEAFFAHVSSNADCYTYIIQARLASKAPDALPEVLTVEERYKLAADEIMMRISS